jgi:predicted transport protein
MDPAVTEEILRLYVAYKAETNFVDVVPQAKRLLLSINIPLSELDDPKGVARDVSTISRWGNGEVEVGVGDLAALPYALGLVRQALDRQLSAGD